MTTYVELRLVSGTVVDDPNQRSGCVGEIRAICDLMILRIFFEVRNRNQIYSRQMLVVHKTRLRCSPVGRTGRREEPNELNSFVS
jgi:hypothetical protein